MHIPARVDSISHLNTRTRGWAWAWTRCFCLSLKRQNLRQAWQGAFVLSLKRQKNLRQKSSRLNFNKVIDLMRSKTLHPLKYLEPTITNQFLYWDRIESSQKNNFVSKKKTEMTSSRSEATLTQVGIVFDRKCIEIAYERCMKDVSW